MLLREFQSLPRRDRWTKLENSRVWAIDSVAKTALGIGGTFNGRNNPRMNMAPQQ